ncbi:claudin-15-like isoform X1 [Podarcis lilfordi]|uniref:Claudin n=1 Tax=Podarcis lilfordi TaxID=74358 RepID=A0AA35P507_9SAUR|nr:claudin-15-like isoform X1 [Podarcis lilfordi]
MASSAFQISALLLAFLGLILLLVASVSNCWKFSIPTTTLITASWIYEGLWMHCVATSLGSVQCKKFFSLLSLETYIQACRALMITSLILGMCGTLLTLLGLKCTQLGSNSENAKSRIAMLGGMVFILAGLSSMVAISWYAERITAQFFDSFYGGTKYELGYALYLGWAGSLLSILGGIFLTCSACKEKHRDYKYAATRQGKDARIYIKQSETVTSAKDYV